MKLQQKQACELAAAVKNALQTDGAGVSLANVDAGARALAIADDILT